MHLVGGGPARAVRAIFHSLRASHWMKQQTKELLDKLASAKFFSHVGEPVPDGLRASVITVSSWRKALRCCCSIEWDNYTLEQRNLLTIYLHSHARNRYRDWNDIAREVKKVAEPLAQDKVTALNHLRQVERTQVLNCVIWAILAACMELEYADIRKPDFFCWLMEFYLLGRY